jgi:hypothetical protein
MICPVEIASDLSALRAARVGDRAKHGVLLENRDGPGNESTGSDSAGADEEDYPGLPSGRCWDMDGLREGDRAARCKATGMDPSQVEFKDRWATLSCNLPVHFHKVGRQNEAMCFPHSSERHTTRGRYIDAAEAESIPSIGGDACLLCLGIR